MAVVSNRAYSDVLNCARVYCCASKTDSNAISEIITDIFECYNNEIQVEFRDDVVIDGYDDIRSSVSVNLSGTQLVIAIVSENFLQQESSDGSMELFHYALNHKIPILPILIERGLEDEFNRKCEGLQLIFRYDTEKYYGALSEHLHRILVSHDIKEQVRSSFYSSIFLSYRREDFAYVEKVMRQIHSFERCKDVGIWYDGALLPGTDYEEEIFSRIEKCSCIVMLVTPRLLEIDNFIMKEYPRVRANGIKILPYVIENVDINRISEYYEGLFDAYPNGIRSSYELQKELEQIIAPHSDAWVPYHEYCVGFAYLFGIDFERNADKATAYLVSAAKAGYYEAYKTLAEAYDIGILESADKSKAIIYEEEYLAALYNRAKFAEEKFAVEELKKECINASRICMRNANYGKAISICINFLEYYNTLKNSDEVKCYMTYADVYNELGFLESVREKYDKALGYYFKAEKCLDEAERVATNNTELQEVRFAHSLVAERIALSYWNYDNGNLVQALNYILISLAPFEHDVLDMNNEIRKVLSRLYYTYGWLLEKDLQSMLNNIEDNKEKIIEELIYIISVYKNAYEYCIESEFSKYITNIEYYQQHIGIQERIKESYYLIFLLKPTYENLEKYRWTLNKIVKMLMNVTVNNASEDVLMLKVDECVYQGVFFKTKGYNEEAKAFYLMALEMLQKIRKPETEKMLEIKKIIDEL